jgi:hypothetical protein
LLVARPQADDRAAHAIQIDLMRKATTAQRFGLARSLTATTIELSRTAIRQRHPDWSELEVLLEFARVHYGAELSDRVRAYLDRRESASAPTPQRDRDA